jgi:hypothetical protein
MQFYDHDHMLKTVERAARGKVKQRNVQVPGGRRKVKTSVTDQPKWIWHLPTEVRHWGTRGRSDAVKTRTYRDRPARRRSGRRPARARRVW